MLQRREMKNVLWFASGVIVVVGMLVPILVKRNSASWPPSLGDWGDYVGAIGTLLAVVWAIGAYLFTHMEIHETQNDLREQMDMLYSAVGAMNRIAATMQGNFANQVAQAMPDFRCTDAMAHPSNVLNNATTAKSNIGYIEIRNDGAAVTIQSIENKQRDWTLSFAKPGRMRTGQLLRLNFERDGSIKGGGPIHVIVRFENQLGMYGWVEITANSPAQLANVSDPQIGQAP